MWPSCTVTRPHFRRTKIFLFLCVVLCGAGPGAVAQDNFTVAPEGCAMAHCDGYMLGDSKSVVPTNPALRILHRDAIPEGSDIGLGCSSNGRVVACSYRNASSPNLVVYDPDGSRLFDSADLLNSSAYTSAPMVSTSGDVIAADDSTVIRFGSDGQVIWRTQTSGGWPISPVLTSNGVVVLATIGGPISAYSVDDGRFLGELYVQDPGDTRTFAAINTPAVVGNRLYISMHITDDEDETARLVALDVDPANAAAPLRVEWHFVFGGPSGATPVVIGDTVYFDGGREVPGGARAPHLFAVRDWGGAPELRWKRATEAVLQAAVLPDPRGGLWYFPASRRHLYRLHHNTGNLLNRLDLDALVSDVGLHMPSSAMTLAQTPAGTPVMLLGATSFYGSGASYFVALDLSASRLLWKVHIADGVRTDWIVSQCAIARTATGTPRIIFPGHNSGAFFVGEN